MKTANDFKTQAKALNITFWRVHDCSICEYTCGYIFRDGHVFYDSGCDCTIVCSTPKPRSYEDVAYMYNSQTNEKVIVEMDEFWGFNKRNAHASA